MKQLLKLALIFARIGAFSFGGGYAMVSFIQREVVEVNPWITNEEMLDMIAISQSTPGVLAVNMATFVGYKVGGVAGSAVATLAVSLPSMLMIMVISYFFEMYKNLQAVAYAFDGIRAGVVVLILSATVKLSKYNARTVFNLAVTLVACALTLFLDISTVYVLLAAAVAGYIYLFVREKPRGGKS